MGHVEANGDTGDPITVTIDVEGFELDYFQMKHDWSSVVGMLVEFHIYRIGDDLRLRLCLENLSKDFVTYHVHANNWELRTFELEGKKCPRVFEVGFMSRHYADGVRPSNESLPIEGLDYPCKPGQEDIDLTYLFE